MKLIWVPLLLLHLKVLGRLPPPLPPLGEAEAEAGTGLLPIHDPLRPKAVTPPVEGELL